MKKKFIYKKKILYNLKGHLFYLFKKKKVKDLLLPKIKNYFELINIFKIIFYYNLFFKYYYLKLNFEIKSEHIFDNLFFKYNIIKNY
jgi:hypothetical protein